MPLTPFLLHCLNFAAALGAVDELSALGLLIAFPRCGPLVRGVIRQSSFPRVLSFKSAAQRIFGIRVRAIGKALVNQRPKAGLRYGRKTAWKALHAIAVDLCRGKCATALRQARIAAHPSSLASADPVPVVIRYLINSLEDAWRPLA